MPFEPVSPLGGFTGTMAAPEREPLPSADDSVWGAAFRTENVVGSSIASEEVRTAREQVGALGGPVRIDPDFDPWAEIVDTPYESYTDQFAKAGNRDHFEAIKADIDRETKDRETIRKSGWTGIGASMAAGVLDLPILLPGGNIIRSAKGGVSLLRTAGSTAAYGTLAAAASESALHGSQQLRTGEESAVVIGGSTVLAGLLGAGIGKLFSRADQAAHAARIEQDFYVPGRGEPDPFTPGSVQVGAAPGASAKAASVADIIRQTAEEILPPGVRVEVADEIGLPKAGATDADSRFSVGGKEFTHQQDIFRAAWADTAGDFETVIAESLESSRLRRFPDGTPERAIFEDLVGHMQNVVKAVDEGDRAAAVKALEAGIAKAKELDDLVNAPSARLWTQRLRSAARKHLMPSSDAKFSVRDTPAIDTPEFKNWFGDSTLVRDGKPEVYYHSTGADIEAFQMGRTTRGDERPIFFHRNPDQAESGASATDAIYPVYLKLENPANTRANAIDWFELDGEWKALRAAGYDGAYVRDEGGVSVAVFSPEQIKSAVGNRGTFDPNDPRIAFGVRKEGPDTIAEGRFDPDSLLITISANALDPIKTLKHEVIHALRAMGLITEKEWKILVRAAKRGGWVESNNVRALYEGVYKDRITDELLAEEAIAEQFSLWRNGAITVTGTVAKLFQRMKDFLDRVGNALRGQGFQNADDVFASVRGGDVAARATPAGRSIPAGGAVAAGSGRATSVGAAGREVVDNTLKPALGLETVRIDPLIYLQNSKSAKTQAYIQELAETPLAYKKNAEGFETAPLGSEMGEPGAVESRIKGWQAPLAEGVRTLENAFMRYRKGRDKLPLDQLRTTIGDAISKPEKLIWRQFKEEVAKAARRGDEHEIPEVAQAAKFARQNVFNPLKDRAIAKELLPEDISVETAESYLNRLYNKEKIIARRPEFKDIVTKWLDEAEAKNMAVSDRLRASLTQFDKTEEFIAKTEAKIATLTKQERDVSIRREEASRFNQFAFKRAQKLSEPIDEARARVVEISTAIEESTNRISEVTEAIREAKAEHPALKSAEKQMFNVIHTVSKVKKATDLFEVVDLAKEIDESVESFVNDLRGVAKGFREAIKDMKSEGLGQQIGDLEKLRARLRKKIAPYTKEIAANKKIIAEEEKAKLAGARGGAVFETAARKRVNTLADRQSGKSSELSNMELRLERHNTNLDALRAEIEEELGRYQGKSARDAVKALEARAKAEDLRLAKAQEEGKEAPVNRLRGADGPVLSSARKIAARVPKEPGETASLADEIIDRILGTPDGRLPYDAHLTKTTSAQGVSSSARGPLAAREFMIPDEMIEDFLENDFEMLMHAYVRTMAPDVELHARFGDVDMKRQFKEIQDDWARKAAAATSEKERRSLHAQRDGDIRRLAAIRDRLRGTYALPSNPDGLLLRTGRVMRSVNYMAMLGGQAISAIPDMGSIVFSHGIMRTFGDGIIPLFRNFSGTRLAAREVKLAGTALDMVLDSRAMNIGEIMDDYGRHSKFERGIQSMARSFGTVSLMSPWNAAMKQTAGLITITRILRASDALARGKIKKPDLERLAASGISESNARKIAEQFKKHGTKEGGVWLPNTENWDKEARAAKEAFRVALVREVDKTIITPGQEKFLWLSSELGKTLGQFKSFSVAANQRLLIAGLQQRDMGTLSGAALMVALGGLVHILKTKAGGREPDIDWSDNEKTSQFMVNAVDRSGLLGWLMEANAISEKVTGGKVGLSALTGRPISRYASRNLVGAMAGPTFGTLQSIGQVSSAGFTEWKETDTRAARRLIPYQNLLYMRHLFDQVEAGTNEFFGVPMKATRH